MIRLNNIKIRENISDIEVFKRAIEKNKIKQEEVEEWYIYKKAFILYHFFMNVSIFFSFLIA